MTVKTGPSASSVTDYYYDYDTGYADLDLGRLKEVQIGSNSYTYDYTGVNPLVQSLTRPNESTTTYTHNVDPLKRLTMIDNQHSTTGTINKHVFTYTDKDVIGNEQITTGTPLDSFTDELKEYTHNNVNQLTDSTNPNRSYLYDNDGNMTQGYTPDGYQFTAGYDAENRLTTLSYNNGSNDYETRYFYSGYSMLVRVEKWDDTATPGTLAKTDETRFVRSGFLPIQERSDSNTVVREYTWGIDKGGGIGGLLNLKEGTANYSFIYDGKGNVMGVLDSSQVVVASYRYDEFGNRLKKTGTFNQPFQFSTKRYDEQTGLSYYGYRFYSPSIGRWLTKDPLGEAGGVNLYGFVGNSAVNLVDPFGLYWFRQPWQIPGVVGRRDTPVPPRGPVSEFIEKHVPAGYTFGEMHDAFVDAATSAGLPDWLVNIPSMLPMYTGAQIVEVLRSLGILDQPKPMEELALCK